MPWWVDTCTYLCATAPSSSMELPSSQPTPCALGTQIAVLPSGEGRSMLTEHPTQLATDQTAFVSSSFCPRSWFKISCFFFFFGGIRRLCWLILKGCKWWRRQEGFHCARATVKISCTHEQDQEFTQPGKKQVNSLLIPLELWCGRLPGHTAFVQGCKKSVQIHFPPCGLFIQVTSAPVFFAL